MHAANRAILGRRIIVFSLQRVLKLAGYAFYYPSHGYIFSSVCVESR